MARFERYRKETPSPIVHQYSNLINTNRPPHNLSLIHIFCSTTCELQGSKLPNVSNILCVDIKSAQSATPQYPCINELSHG